MRRRKNVQLPQEGDAFAFLLDDGRYGVCRVIRVGNKDDVKFWGEPVVLYATSPWIGDEVPKADEPALQEILFLNHHFWDNSTTVSWTNEEVPDSFIAIGKIPPSEEELKLESHSFSEWLGAGIDVLTQWRWDHDREALLAEEAEEEEANQRLQEARAEEARKELLSMTLEKLAKHRFFPDWGSMPSKKATDQSRKIMQRTVAELASIGKGASEEARMAVLQGCIEAFNDLDEKLEFIMTDEREDICAEFEILVHACGLGKYEDLADRWREW